MSRQGEELYYDRAGRLIPLERFAELSDNERYTLVCVDRIEGVYVGTFWLGVDLDGRGSEPAIFESQPYVVCRDNEGQTTRVPLDAYATRYRTEREAIAGHAALCELVRMERAGNPDTMFAVVSDSTEDEWRSIIDACFTRSAAESRLGENPVLEYGESLSIEKWEIVGEEQLDD